MRRSGLALRKLRRFFYGWNPDRAAAILPPTLSSVSPDLGDTLGGSMHTLTGANLATVSGVTVGGVAATDVSAISGSSVSFRMPTKAAGTYDVALTTGGGTDTLSSALEAWSPIETHAAARLFQADSGVTTATSATTYEWRQLTNSAAYEVRDGARVHYLAATGKYWLLGGWQAAPVAAWDNQITTNQVWSSTDLVTWTAELAHDSSPPTSGAGARWRQAHTFATCLHTYGGTEYIYVVGGDTSDGTPWRDDVWRSSDGTTWERVLANIGREPKYLASLVSFGGALHLFGGYAYSDGNATDHHYKSTDGGATWTAESAMGMTRANFGDVAVVGSSLVIAGGATGHAGSATLKNDAWSWDGTTWTQKTANGGFDARQYHGVAVYDSKVWVLAGGVATNDNTVWYSSDLGANWTQIAYTPWEASHADSVCVTDTHGIVVASGNQREQRVWTLKSEPTAPVTTWVDRGSGGLSLSQATAAYRPVLRTSAIGSNDAVRLDGYDDLMELSTNDVQASGRSVFMVCRSLSRKNFGTGFSPDATIIGDSGGGTGDNQFGFDTYKLAYFDLSAGTDRVRATAAVTDDVVRTYGVTHDTAGGGTVKLYTAGAQVGTTATGIGYSVTTAGWRTVGAGIFASSFGQADLGAFVVVSGIVDSAFIAKFEKWAKKWGAV